MQCNFFFFCNKIHEILDCKRVVLLLPNCVRGLSFYLIFFLSLGFYQKGINIPIQMQRICELKMLLILIQHVIKGKNKALSREGKCNVRERNIFSNDKTFFKLYKRYFNKIWTKGEMFFFFLPYLILSN